MDVGHKLKMKCIRVRSPKEPLVYTQDDPIPKPPKGGAVVKIAYAGVCHSDVNFWEGGYALENGEMLKYEGRPGFKYPCTPGHEIAGHVFSMDESVAEGAETGLKLGDSVIVYPWICCNSCRACKSGYNALCDGSPPIYVGMTQDGGFAEYVSVPDVRYLIPSRSIPLDVACLLPCSGLTAYHAVEEGLEFVKSIMAIKGNCSVLSLGAGGLGQWGVRFARALYPPETQIVCADVKQEALAAATLNVRDIIPFLISRDQSSEATAQQVKSITSSGNGMDLVLDFVGATKTYELSRKSLRSHGHYHVIGLLGGEARFHLPDMVLNGIQMKGIKVGSLVQLKRLVQLVVDKPDVYANLLYKVHPLEDGIKVMESLAKGKVVGRAILRCSEGN